MVLICSMASFLLLMPTPISTGSSLCPNSIYMFMERAFCLASLVPTISREPALQQLPAEGGGSSVDLGRVTVGTQARWCESLFPFIPVFHHPTVTQTPLLPVSFPQWFWDILTKVVAFIVGLICYMVQKTIGCISALRGKKTTKGVICGRSGKIPTKPPMDDFSLLQMSVEFSHD